MLQVGKGPRQLVLCFVALITTNFLLHHVVCTEESLLIGYFLTPDIIQSLFSHYEDVTLNFKKGPTECPHTGIRLIL